MKFVILTAIFLIIPLLYIKYNPELVSYLTYLPPFNIISIAKNYYGDDNVSIDFDKLFLNLLFVVIVLFSSIYLLIYNVNNNVIKGGTINISTNFVELNNEDNEDYNEYKYKKNFII
jgi:di/tricarboxylate transporter